MKEVKVSINHFSEYTYNTPLLHQLVLRIITTRPGTMEQIKNLGLDLIKNTYEERHATQGLRPAAEVLSHIDKLKTQPIVYSKTQEIEYNATNHMYYQMVLDLEGMTFNRNGGFLASLKNILRGASAIRGAWLGPGMPDDVVIQIGNVNLDLKGDQLILGSSNLTLEKLIRFYNVENNIAVRVGVRNDKVYHRGSLVKMNLEWFDDIVSALDGPSVNLLGASTVDNVFPPFLASQFVAGRQGEFYFRLMYKNRVRVARIGRSIVVYDGNTCFEESAPYIKYWQEKVNARLIVLCQFANNKDLFFTVYSNNLILELNKVILHFIRKDKILYSTGHLGMSNGGTRMEGQISCLVSHKGKQRKMAFPLNVHSPGTTYYLDLIIPVNEDKIQLRALEWVSRLIDAQVGQVYTDDYVAHLREVLQQYPDFLQNNITPEGDDDILSTWFKFCTKATANMDAQVVQSYERMKARLEEEYKGLASYVNHFDFSKCMAIPQVEMDKKTKNNYYKTLHVEPQNVIINSINNQRINPIQETKAMVRVMATVQCRKDKNELVLIGEYPLRKYYDAKTNRITFNYGDMKGEVIRDKIKDRR